MPPFLPLALELKVLAKYLYFSPRVKKKPHQGTKSCFKFSLSRTTAFFAFISKLENNPDATARAAAAPGAACEAQALLTPLTMPRPAFPHPTSEGFKKQHHTDARYTPGRTLPPQSHESQLHDGHGGWLAASMGGCKEQTNLLGLAQIKE